VKLTQKQAVRLLTHLQEADVYLRDLFGFYWHRRRDGIPAKRRRALVRVIQRGEKQIALIGKKARALEA
jgi:hypothetical protein